MATISRVNPDMPDHSGEAIADLFIRDEEDF